MPAPAPCRLQDRVAIVTSGAGSVGAAIVRVFDAEGARVVIADVQDHRGRALARSLCGARGEAVVAAPVVYRHVDVSREADVMAMVELALEHFGRLDVLVNHAGFYGPAGSIVTLDASGLDATLAVLLRGVFLGIKHAMPVMKRQGGGSIISTAGMAGLRTGLAGL